MIINSPEKNKIEWQYFQVISERTQFFFLFISWEMEENIRAKIENKTKTGKTTPIRM